MARTSGTVVGGLDGRKHERRHQHILDTYAIDSVRAVSSCLASHAPAVTPNMVTVVGNVARFTGVALFAVNRHPAVCIVLTVFGIYMDNVDGHLARLTNRVTDLGDKLDHYSDWAWGASLGVVYVAVYLTRAPTHAWLSCVTVAMLLLYTVQFGALERAYHARCPHESQIGTGSTAFTKGLSSRSKPEHVLFATRPLVGNVIMACLTLAFMWRCMASRHP